MTFPAGKQLGSYEIVELLGKGGMGEVYRARDAKLKREVAIKILPEEFSRDPDRLARFEREAELLASLNHPNVATIYDFEEVNTTHFLVLELVEGETLAERIQRGPIPVEDALSIAKHICEGLEAAHEKGVIHRDLKPANVKVTPDGTVKVLDFGLAKAMETSPAATTLSNSPTLTITGTSAGIIIGTAAYMSPEQARGRAADHRSDVFAFGCVLYEMLSGKQAFDGEDVSDVLATVMKTEPDLRILPQNLDSRLLELLRRCLAKNRRDRWHAIGDIRLEIEAIRANPYATESDTVSEIHSPVWKRALPALITGLLGAAIAAGVMWSFRPLPKDQIVRFAFVLPKEQSFSRAGRSMIAISPDGANIVYVANQQLYLKNIGEMDAKPIPGTNQDASNPFFSPDGQWIGFYSWNDRKIKKISITGGASVDVSEDQQPPFGASWESDDHILFGGGPAGILRISANGGKPEKVVSVQSGELAHGPQLLEGKNAILFTLANNAGDDRWDTAKIVVHSLKPSDSKVVMQGGSDARYLPSGHLLYTLGPSLFAIRFDIDSLQTIGGPVPMVDGVMRPDASSTGTGQFSISDNGTLVWIANFRGQSDIRSLVIVDRMGTKKPLGTSAGSYFHPRFSPDGKQIAYALDDGKNGLAIWIYDLSGTSAARRLTFGGRDGWPLWSRDGQRIAFRRDTGNPWVREPSTNNNGLFWQRANGNGPAERLTTADKGLLHSAESWSADGKTLTFFNDGDIWSVSIEGDRKPKPLIAGKGTQDVSSISPDGRWIAYYSNESIGRASGGIGDIYVEPFPPTGSKYQITTTGGTHPLWSPDGKQLFYLEGTSSGTSRITSVDIRTVGGFTIGKPSPLPITFRAVGTNSRPYDISPDGNQFIVMLPPAQAETTERPTMQINIILNWLQELKQRVATR